MAEQTRRLRRVVALVSIVAVAAALLSACTVPTVFVVTTTTDAVDAVPGDGVCEAVISGECTLRAAVMEASAGSGPVRIELAPGATYQLTIAGNDDAGAVGDLDVAGDVTVLGAGATISSGAYNRVIEHHSGRLELRDVRVRAGWTSLELESEDGFGGGILNHGTLVLVDAELTANTTDRGGAAIHQTGGSTALLRTRVHYNWGGYGGHPVAGIFVEDGDLTVVASELSSQVPQVIPTGYYVLAPHAAVWQLAGSATVVGSTIGRNFPQISFCGEPCRGDGIVADGTMEIRRSTFAENDDDIAGSGAVTVSGSLLERCAAPVISAGYNRDVDGSCLVAPSTGDVTSAAAVVGALDFHGATTRSYLPLAGGAAVDAIPPGTVGLCEVPGPGDQRGQAQPVGVGCDIGSVERQPSDP